MLTKIPCIVNVCRGESTILKIKGKCIKWKLSRDNGLTYNLIQDECSPCLKVEGTILSNCYLYKAIYKDKHCCKQKKVFKLCVDFLNISLQPKSVCIDDPTTGNPKTATFISGYKNNPDCNNIVKCTWEIMTGSNPSSWVPVIPNENTKIIKNGNMCTLIIENITSNEMNGNMYRVIFENKCGKIISKIVGLAIGPYAVIAGNVSNYTIENDPSNMNGQWTTGGISYLASLSTNNTIFGISSLISPIVPIAIDGNYYLELGHFGNLISNKNGGNVKLSVNSGTFNVVPNSSFLQGGYNNETMDSGEPNLGGEEIWTGDFNHFMLPSRANLGNFDKGDIIQIRFDVGWNITPTSINNLWQIFSAKITCVEP